MMGIITLNPAKKAKIDQAEALREVDAWFQTKLDAGYTADGGYVLGLSDPDVTLLTGNFVLAKEAAALGAPLPPVIDKAGGVHAVESIEDLTLLMLAYGQYRASLSAEYAARKAAIEG
jgi:hypothetical protein